MAVGPTAGSKLYIAPPGSIPVSPDAYIEIGEIADLRSFGRQYNKITSEAVGDRKVRKYKGTYDDGTMTLKLNRDPSDTGQGDLQDAVDSDDDYQFKVVLNDDTVALTIATTITFAAKVMSYTTELGGPNNVTQATAVLEIQSGTIVETAAH